ncbi:5222_t:CDS:2, partial [Gigaspora rosea]
MDPLEIPSNIKKTLGLLENQIKKANLPGTCVIFQNEIVYQEESRSYRISVEDAKRELPPGQNWVEKATYL